MDIRSVVITSLAENGVHILEKEYIDVDLREYEIDSISFVSFIISLEEHLNISIPEEYLHIDVLQSLDGFVLLLEQLITDQTKKTSTAEQI